MFKAEFFYSSQGARKEQLDRFQTVDTGQCVIFMLTDGYDCCSAKPHYVEWLCEQLEGLKDSKLNCTVACLEIEKLLKQTDGSPGKASVAFVVSDNESYWFTSLGDTRIYWLSEGRRTEDHSLAQLAVDRGQCPPDKLRFHPHRHTLTRHIGAGLKYHPEWIRRAVSENEQIVICTDGFWCQLSDDCIYKITTHTDLKQLLDNVLTLPQEDNLSVVLLHME